LPTYEKNISIAFDFTILCALNPIHTCLTIYFCVIVKSVICCNFCIVVLHTSEIEELYGFDGTKQLNIILSSVSEKTMRDLERTKERKFRKYAQTLDPRYKSSDKSMEYDNTKITTNDPLFLSNAFSS
jgi:hypothetical protein